MRHPRHQNQNRPTGFSLMELVAVVAILSVLATLTLTRIQSAMDDAHRTTCHVNRAEIELQARLWKKQNSAWPAADLADIGADVNYLPEGIPTCPLTGTTYTIDAATGEVVGHDH